MEPTTVVVVGREQMWRDLVEHYLHHAFEGANCVAYDFDTVLSQVHPADSIFVLLEIGQDGCDLLEDVRMLHAAFSSVPIAIISDCFDRKVVLRAYSLGVKGYLSPSMELQSLASMLRILSIGGEVMSPMLFVNANGGGELPEEVPDPAAMRRPVTDKEREVLSLVRMGKPNKVIAAHLELDEAVVKNHVRNLMRKTGTRNRVQLALSARDFAD